jgi:hypothetical protein
LASLFDDQTKIMICYSINQERTLRDNTPEFWIIRDASSKNLLERGRVQVDLVSFCSRPCSGEEANFYGFHKGIISA